MSDDPLFWAVLAVVISVAVLLVWAGQRKEDQGR